MNELPKGTVVLFVGGDPLIAEERAHQPPVIRPLARILLPSPIGTGTPRARTRGVARQNPARQPSAAVLYERDRGFPADQLMCAERLLDAARKSGTTVRVVDVNQPEDGRELIARWMTAKDVLPVLVRADGMRLVGKEAFTPGALRRFLSAP